MSRVAPIQITRRDENATAWGWVGDYEVCIRGDRIKTR
jgi:hypothetical protein